jgi:hypothetical protein
VLPEVEPVEGKVQAICNGLLLESKNIDLNMRILYDEFINKSTHSFNDPGVYIIPLILPNDFSYLCNDICPYTIICDVIINERPFLCDGCSVDIIMNNMIEIVL